MTQKARTPRAFKLDDLEEKAKQNKTQETISESKTKPVKAKPKANRAPRAIKDTAVLTPIPDDAAQRNTHSSNADEDVANRLTPPPLDGKKRQGFSWGKLFWSAFIGLISLSFGLWVDHLIRNLFARTDWLGWLALGLTALLCLAAFAFVVREIWGMARMKKIDQLRNQARQASDEDNMQQAKAVSVSLEKLYLKRPELAHSRAALAEHRNQIIDGRDLMRLAERDLMKLLDDKARGLVMGAAKRVSIVTAVSPRALVDIAFVLVENIKLMRQLADLYGGRPGPLGFWRLARTILAHLAITGSIAIGDGLLQQVLSHGVAAKLSSRLGEGVINGLLTARIGIAAIDVCRPLPFSDQTRPGIKDFMGELVNFSGDKTATKTKTGAES